MKRCVVFIFLFLLTAAGFADTEPQFTMLHWGAGQPEFQVFAGRNMQFL